jgi:hypothetical protein
MCAAERTLTIDFSGDGAGTVEVAGQSCDASAGSCAFAVGDGDTVRITATGRSTDDPSWSAGSCSGAECDVAISGDATVTLTWTLRHNIAFITSADYVAGNIGSVANADSLCAQAATAAGLHPTSWVALLGSVAACPGEVSGPCVPFDRLAGARGWVNTRGEPLFDMPDQLGPSTDLWFPVRYDEDGAGDEDRQIVTGLNILGAVANNCTDYTDNASASRTAWARAGTTSTNAFSQNSNGSCALAYHLFCLSTDHTDPLPAPNAVGRLVFVTEQLFTPTTGLTTADAMCQREACDAGLTGGTDCNGADPGSLRTFRALLETEGATAGSRFDSTGPDYVRADGVPVLAAASLAGPTASISPASTLDLYADGRRVAGISNTFIGASGGETCSDWSSDQNDARSLINDNVFFTFDRVATRPCSGVARVICLEE